MKLLSAVLLLVGVVVCYGADPEPVKCSVFPEATTEEQKKPLILDDFVKKTWHEIKTIGTRYGGGDCTSIKYEKVAKKGEIEEHVKTTYSQYKDKKKADDVTIYLKAKAGINKYSDSFDVYKAADLKDKFDDLHYQILTTDYEKYALVYGCNVKDNIKTERMAKLSTSAKLEKAEEDKMDATLKLLEPAFPELSWTTLTAEDSEKCSASIFGLSTVLSVIVAMFLILRN